jgi:hypothetical protein
MKRIERMGADQRGGGGDLNIHASASFRPAAKHLLSVSRPACLVVAQKFEPSQSRGGGARAKQVHSRPPGRQNGLVAKSYFLLFLAAFFVEAFFVDFLAVFLAAAM